MVITKIINIPENKMRVKLTIRKYCLGKENASIKNKLLEKLNIKESTLSRWLSLNDNNGPGIEDLPAIAEVFNTTVDGLYGIEDERIEKALELYNAYINNPRHKHSIDSLLGLK